MKLGLGNKQADGEGGRGGSSLMSYWLLAYVVTALAVGLAMAGMWLQQQQHDAALRRAGVALRSEDLARRLTGTVALYRKSLEGLAADPQLPLLVSDAAHRGERERILAAVIPAAIKVRLLAPKEDQTEPNADPPFGYAALALLRAAEKRAGPTPLELDMAHSPKAHLAGAVRLANGPGLVYVAWGAGFLRHWLDKLGGGVGRVELQQEVEGRYVSLFANAHAPPASGEPDAVHPVAGSRLRVAHWYGPGPAAGNTGLAFALLAAALALVCAGGGGWFQYGRMRRALASDQAMLVGLAEDILAGRKPRRAAMRVTDFAHVGEILQQHLKNVREQPGEPPRGEQAGDAQPQADGWGKRIEVSAEPRGDNLSTELPEVIFRPYDIRGMAGYTLTPGVVKQIGRAVGSEAYDRGQQAVIVARDAEQAGADLTESLIAGINATGRDVVDLGVAPVPVLYFATHFLGSNCGVMVTGSQDQAEYNGLTVVMGGETLAGSGIQALRERVEHGDLLEGAGTTRGQSLVHDYIQRVGEDVSIARPLKVVVDGGDGCVAPMAADLYRALGCEVVALQGNTGDQPAHHADPSRPENLKDLRAAVLAEQADLGLAFDGDGDRFGVVDARGRIVWPDRVMMLLSADVLTRHPGGDVIFDVRCSRALASQILRNGGRPVMWKSGHFQLKAKLKESGALLAGGWSGNIIFGERWYGFADALYAGARLLEVLSVETRNSAEVFDDYPDMLNTPELYLNVQEGRQYEIMERLQQRGDLLDGAKLTTIDGLRAELGDGWGLVRASSTASVLSFRFEADNEAAMARIQDLYRNLLATVAPDLKPPF